MRIKEKRIESKITQRQLAILLGVKQNTISNWENGVREPSFVMMIEMSKIFDCTLDDLVKGE